MCKNHSTDLSTFSVEELAEAFKLVLKEVTKRELMLVSSADDEGIDPSDIFGFKKEISFEN